MVTHGCGATAVPCKYAMVHGVQLCTVKTNPSALKDHETKCLHQIMEPAIEVVNSVTDEVGSKMIIEDPTKLEHLRRDLNGWHETNKNFINRLQNPAGPFEPPYDSPSMTSLPSRRYAIRIGEGILKSIVGVALSGNGRRVVTASSDGTIRLWAATSGCPLFRTYMCKGTTAVAINRDGSKVVLGMSAGAVQVLESLSGNVEVRCTCPITSGSVCSVATCADVHRIAVGTVRGEALIFDGRTGSLIWTVPLAGCEKVLVAMCEDGGYVAMGMGRTVMVWNADEPAGLKVRPEGHSREITSIAISNDGRRVVTGSLDGTAKRWEHSDGSQLQRTFGDHEDWVLSVALNGDGSRMVMGLGSGFASIWDADDGILIQLIEGEELAVDFVGMEESGVGVLTGTVDGAVKVWGPAKSGIQNKALKNPAHKPLGRVVKKPGVVIVERGRR
ncbi:hypothetical protein HDV00_000227 [Rhizophlyctis rosea]|nr:hypothetical protein HDV00_000227 [Rhizophlyctis rosea]